MVMRILLCLVHLGFVCESLRKAEAEEDLSVPEDLGKLDPHQHPTVALQEKKASQSVAHTHKREAPGGVVELVFPVGIGNWAGCNRWADDFPELWAQRAQWRKSLTLATELCVQYGCSWILDVGNDAGDYLGNEIYLCGPEALASGFDMSGSRKNFAWKMPSDAAAKTANTLATQFRSKFPVGTHNIAGCNSWVETHPDLLANKFDGKKWATNFTAAMEMCGLYTDCDWFLDVGCQGQEIFLCGDVPAGEQFDMGGNLPSCALIKEGDVGIPIEGPIAPQAVTLEFPVGIQNWAGCNRWADDISDLWAQRSQWKKDPTLAAELCMQYGCSWILDVGNDAGDWLGNEMYICGPEALESGFDMSGSRKNYAWVRHNNGDSAQTSAHELRPKFPIGGAPNIDACHSFEDQHPALWDLLPTAERAWRTNYTVAVEECLKHECGWILDVGCGGHELYLCGDVPEGEKFNMAGDWKSCALIRE